MTLLSACGVFHFAGAASAAGGRCSQQGRDADGICGLGQPIRHQQGWDCCVNTSFFHALHTAVYAAARLWRLQHVIGAC
jgi:hypothetical protein